MKKYIIVLFAIPMPCIGDFASHDSVVKSIQAAMARADVSAVETLVKTANIQDIQGPLLETIVTHPGLKPARKIQYVNLLLTRGLPINDPQVHAAVARAIKMAHPDVAFVNHLFKKGVRISELDRNRLRRYIESKLTDDRVLPSDRKRFEELYRHFGNGWTKFHHMDVYNMANNKLLPRRSA